MIRSVLHKDFLQEKYETLQERDVKPDDEWCLDILNMIFVQTLGVVGWCDGVG